MAASYFCSLVAVCIVAALTILGKVHGVMQIKAMPYDMMGSPPNLTGPMEQNFLLSDAERYKIGQLKGPESFVYHNGRIYTGLADGRIVDISDCGVRTIAQLSAPTCTKSCSRPMGLRMSPDGKLIVADSGTGILSVNLQTGAIERLFDVKWPINGRRCKHINDLVVARDGTILFTDSSAKWSASEQLYIILEGESTGRLIALNPKTRKAIVVIPELSYPNGLEFGPNEEYLLIAETSRARIRKLDLRQRSPTWRRQFWFAINLPGLPDNIRASGRGTFWVAMQRSRNSNMTSSYVDQYAPQPEMRNMIAMIADMNKIEEVTEKYGTIVEMDVSGNIIRSLQDPTGERIAGVSEVLERDGFLYLGNRNQLYVSRVPLSPKFDVDRFIAKIKSTCRARKMNLANLRKVLRRLVAIAELRKALLEAKKYREEMERAQSTTTPAPVSMNTTESSSSSNMTDVSNMTQSTTPDTSTNVTSESTSTPQPSTTPSDDAVTTVTTTMDPEAGDGDTAASTTAASSSTGTSPTSDSAPTVSTTSATGTSSVATASTGSTATGAATSATTAATSAPTTQTATVSGSVTTATISASTATTASQTSTPSATP